MFGSVKFRPKYNKWRTWSRTSCRPTRWCAKLYCCHTTSYLLQCTLTPVPRTSHGFSSGFPRRTTVPSHIAQYHSSYKPPVTFGNVRKHSVERPRSRAAPAGLTDEPFRQQVVSWLGTLASNADISPSDQYYVCHIFFTTTVRMWEEDSVSCCWTLLGERIAVNMKINPHVVMTLT